MWSLFAAVFKWSQSTSNEFIPYVVISIWIIFLDRLSVPFMSDFAARKLCHSACGFGIMNLDPTSQNNQFFVWLVSISSISMTWSLLPFIPNFRFGRRSDVGITIYLTLVSVWFYLHLPPPLLMPLFFADPAAAIVGKGVGNRRWNPKVWGNKTLAGSTTVVLITYLTITYACSVEARLLIAAMSGIAEAVGGDFDNAAIGGVVLGGYLVFGQT